MLFSKTKTYRNGEISVSDQEVIVRLHFLGLTTEDLGVIAAWTEICEASLHSLVDIFYQHVLSNQQTRAILEKHSSIERQRPMLTKYIQTMFQGRVDDEYVKYRRHVGVIHDRIDLDSNWYIAMYEIIRRELVTAVKKAGASKVDLNRFQEALSRLIQADIALVITALTDSRRDQLEEALNGKMKKEFDIAKSFLDEEAKVLEKVAARDLTMQMVGEYPPQYENIKQMLNDAVLNLQQTLSQVSLSAEQVNSAANEISASSQVLAQSSSEQASSLEEAAASLEEMGSIIQQNAANAKEARSLSEATRHSTERGVQSMQNLTEAIDKIKASSDATAKIVKTIDEIAFQTNLLALNAAVEAARAGDAGKGFAVVADEVRSLAMRSAEAARQTANLIEDSVKNAGSGVAVNKEMLSNLQEITQQVEKVSVVMQEIAASSQQQAQSVEQLNAAVEQMNLATQQAAANSEESAAAAEELSGQSQELFAIVGQFRLAQKSDAGHGPLRAPLAASHATF